MISIHQRVFVSALVTLCLFLGLSAWVLDSFFSNHVEKNIHEQLQNMVYSLLASAYEDKQGRMRLPELLADPKLNQPDSGSRAYIQGENKSYQWFSASTINSNFTPPKVKPLVAGEKQFSINKNNYSQLIFVVSWEDYQAIEQNYTLVVEIQRTEILQQITNFRYQLGIWLGGSGLLLLVGLSLLLNWSLKPLRQANQELKQIQQGKLPQLSQSYPQELLLLTNNINQLVQLSISRLQRYRNSLGDLTHSLKTPLAIIQGAYDSKNNQQLRIAITAQLGRINELVQYQLQKASIAGENSDFSSIKVQPLLEKIIRSLDKVYAEKQVNCQLSPCESILFKGDEGDLMELIGNLLDNAYKYGKKNIIISLQQIEQQLLLIIEDDGKGINQQQYAQLLQRGKRADSQLPGHGIGLGIVVDIIKHYKGNVELAKSEQLKGLKVIITLPNQSS
ncbi:MAG: ATP-binding protein [Pseudomonadota bacterium]